MPASHFLGFDPGGQFGAALFIVENGQCECLTECTASVDDALAWATSHLRGQIPKAAGLDAYLYWETTKSGWRQADRWLRNKYPTVKDSVLSSNSAAGAMSVQGMALAMLLRKRWPEIELVETHPKVLYYALTRRKYKWPSQMTEWLVEQLSCSPIQFTNDHCWDAAASAWAAFKGHTGSWKHDLRAKSPSALEPAGPCAFWWPEM